MIRLTVITLSKLSSLWNVENKYEERKSDETPEASESVALNLVVLSYTSTTTIVKDSRL